MPALAWRPDSIYKPYQMNNAWYNETIGRYLGTGSRSKKIADFMIFELWGSPLGRITTESWWEIPPANAD